MLNFIFEVEQADIIEFLYVLFKDIGAKIMNIFEYFRLQLLDTLLHIVVLLSNIRLQEKTHDIGV